MEETISRVEPIIKKWDLDAETIEKFSSPFYEDRKEAKVLIEATIGLQKVMQEYVKQDTCSEILIKAQKLLSIAIRRLQKEFYRILSANRKNLDYESVSNRSRTASWYNIPYSVEELCEGSDLEENTPLTPPRTLPRTPVPDPMSEAERASEIVVADLKLIADCMLACGYGKEGITNYKAIRKSIVDESLSYVGVENYETLNTYQLKRIDWTILDGKIKKWMHAIKVAIKILFSAEKLLCEIVFSSNEKTSESCFTEICKDAAMNLFMFPVKFGKCSKILTPEKMFRALDIYELISSLWPEIESVFSKKSLEPVRLLAVEALAKLGEAVRFMLSQFEAAILKDSSKSPAGGGIHPLTRYVMNYLDFMSDYKVAVSDIMEDWPVKIQPSCLMLNFSSHKQLTEAKPRTLQEKGIHGHLVWLILVLLNKLDIKAAQYNNRALSYLFLTNNLNYIVSKVRSSNLGTLLGSDWIEEHDKKFEQFLAKYKIAGWGKVISSLPEDPTLDIPEQEVKQHFKQFSTNFHEEYKKQCSWSIPDAKLCDQVRISLVKKITPGYRIFYQKYRDRYTKGAIAPEELDTCMSDLFSSATITTTNGSCGRRRRISQRLQSLKLRTH